MTLSLETYRKKLRGCFIGQAVGGTLGLPMEGHLETKPFTFYDPVPTGMVANDDLDLQVVWLECLRKYGLPVNRYHLSEAWKDHMRCAPDEYGAALRNLAAGVRPPLSGRRENHFTDGMGSAIRSEIWAALAPGDPKLAVRLCREDAVVDHDGCGAEACIFLTAIESAAYLESDREKLIDGALGFLTPGGRLHSALCDVRVWWRETPDFMTVRGKILEKYVVDNWTDVTINLSLILLAWYAGAGDFSRSICIAAEMGYDADCTCATLGSILGMIQPDGIEPRWTAPLGDDLILSNCIVAMHPVATIGELCVQIEAMAGQVQDFYKSAVRFDGTPAVDEGASAPWTDTDAVSLRDGYSPLSELLAVEPFLVEVQAEREGDLRKDEPRAFTLTVRTPDGKPVSGEVTLVPPYGLTVEPARLALDGKPVRFTATTHMDECAARNLLRLAIRANGVQTSVEMGLPQAMPWTMDGKRTEGGFTTAFPAGEHVFEITAVLPNRFPNAIILCEGTAPVKVELDGETVLEHQADQYVPATHRSGHPCSRNLTAGPHSIRIHVSAKEAGEFCFGIAGYEYWMWNTDMRYLPAK